MLQAILAIGAVRALSNLHRAASLTVEFAGTPLLRFRVRVGSRDQKWANIGYVLLCLRSHPLMRRSQPNEQTDLTLQERADCGRSAGRDSWEVMKWKEPLAQIPRRHQVSDTVIHKWRERFYVNWAVPLPLGEGGAKRRVRVASLFKF